MSVVLVAGGGEMTVGRQTATYVYGSFDVVLPEGREQVETDDRLDDGYVYRPSDRPTGRFDTQFVRADVKIDLGAGNSDLEATLDGAQDRVAGDVFFDRDITGPGLGVARPGIDYETGDVVRVVAWGKYLALPVTAIDMITGTPPWRVHVGGQLISDAAGLRKHNDDIAQQIAAEKRQRLREVGEVRKTATTAATQAAEVRAALAGPAATPQDLTAQLEALNAQLQEAGETGVDLGFFQAYMAANTQRWALQEQVDAFQEELIAQHARLIQATQAQLEEMQRETTATLMLNYDQQSAENEYMRLTRSGGDVSWSVKSGWVGHFTVLAGTEGSGLGWANRLYMVRFLAPNPSESVLRDSTGVAGVQVMITITPGQARRFSGGPTAGTLARNSWTALHQFTVPQATTMTANGSLTWPNKTHVAAYGLRITLDGRDITSSSVSPAAPLLHHAARPASATSSVQAVRAGAVVRLEALADHANSLNREYRDAKFTVNYIDPTAT